MADNEIEASAELNNPDSLDVNVNATISIDNKNGGSPEVEDIKKVLRDQADLHQAQTEKAAAESSKNQKIATETLGKTLEEIKNTLVSLNTATQNIAKSIASSPEAGISPEISKKNPTAIPTPEDNQLVAAFSSRSFQTNYKNTLSEAFRQIFSENTVKTALAESIAEAAEKNGSSAEDAGISNDQKAEVIAINESDQKKLADKIYDAVFSAIEKTLDPSDKEELSKLSGIIQEILGEVSSSTAFNTQTSDRILNLLNQSLTEIKERFASASKEEVASAPEVQAPAEKTAEAEAKIDKFILNGVAEDLRIGDVSFVKLIENLDKFIDKSLKDNSAAAGEVNDKIVDGIDKLVSDKDQEEEQQRSPDDWYNTMMKEIQGSNEGITGALDEFLKGFMEGFNTPEEEIFPKLIEMLGSFFGGNEIDLGSLFGIPEAPAAPVAQAAPEPQKPLEAEREKAPGFRGFAGIVSSIGKIGKAVSKLIPGLKKDEEKKEEAEAGEEKNLEAEEKPNKIEDGSGIEKTRNTSEATNIEAKEYIKSEVKSQTNTISVVEDTIKGLEKEKKSKTESLRLTEIEKSQKTIVPKKEEPAVSKEQEKPQAFDLNGLFTTGLSSILPIAMRLKDVLGSAFGSLMKVFSSPEKKPVELDVPKQAEARQREGGPLEKIMALLSGLSAFSAESMPKAKQETLSALSAGAAKDIASTPLSKFLQVPGLMSMFMPQAREASLKIGDMADSSLDKASAKASIVKEMLLSFASSVSTGLQEILDEAAKALPEALSKNKESVAKSIQEFGDFLAEKLKNVFERLKTAPEDLNESAASAEAEDVEEELETLEAEEIKTEIAPIVARQNEDIEGAEERASAAELSAEVSPIVEEPERELQTSPVVPENKILDEADDKEIVKIERTLEKDAPKNKNIARESSMSSTEIFKPTPIAFFRNSDNPDAVEEINELEELEIKKKANKTEVLNEQLSNYSAISEDRIEKASQKNAKLESFKTKMAEIAASRQISFQTEKTAKQSILDKIISSARTKIDKVFNRESSNDNEEELPGSYKTVEAVKVPETFEEEAPEKESIKEITKTAELKTSEDLVNKISEIEETKKTSIDAVKKDVQKSANIEKIDTVKDVSSYITKVEDIEEEPEKLGKEPETSEFNSNVSSLDIEGDNTEVNTEVTASTKNFMTNALTTSNNIKKFMRDVSVSIAQRMSALDGHQEEEDQLLEKKDYKELLTSLPDAIATGLAVYFDNKHLKLAREEEEQVIQVEADDAPTDLA